MFKSLLRFFLIVQSMICLGKCSPKHLKRMYVLLFLGRIFYRCQLWQVDCLAFQASLSMGFSRQEYWSGLPFPPLGDFPDSGIAQASPMSSELQEDSLLLSRWEAPLSWLLMPFKSFISLQIFSLFYWLLEGGIKFSRYVSFFLNNFINFCFMHFMHEALLLSLYMGFPDGAMVKNPLCQCRRHKRHRFDSWVRKIPWSRKRQPAPVFLPGKSHGARRLAGYSLWGHKESDTTKWLSKRTHRHFAQGMVLMHTP